jgi:hypothetical protein
MKYISISEFRELGLLAEVNRAFFHPIGLALEAGTDDCGVPTHLSGIRDFRDDPEGVIFSEQMFPKELIEKAQNFIKQKHEKRLELLRYIVQEKKEEL